MQQGVWIRPGVREVQRARRYSGDDSKAGANMGNQPLALTLKPKKRSSFRDTFRSERGQRSK